MFIPEYLHKLARRCLRLSKTAIDPEVIEQMQVWAVDLADEAERGARQSKTAQRTRWARATERRRRNFRSRSKVLQ
jgi:hypothetical protein